MTPQQSCVLPTKTVRNIGIAQIVIGALCVVCQLVNLVLQDLVGFVGAGLYGGVVLVSWLTFSVFSIPLAVNVIICASVGVLLESTAPNQYYPPEMTTTPWPHRAEKVSFDAGLAVSGLSGLITSIIACVYATRALCRLKQDTYEIMQSEQGGL